MAGIGTDIYNQFFGRPGAFQESPNIYNPQQQASLNQALAMGQQGLGTNAIEGLARRGFQQQTVPLLSERFAKSGGLGSSGYQNALISEGGDLEAKLAALRQGNAMDLLKLGLTPQTNQYFEEGTEGLIAPLTKMLADAGLTYATGGANKLGPLLDQLKKLFGGQNGDAEQAQPSQPAILKQLQGQTGNQLLNQAAMGSIGMPQRTPSYNTVLQQAQRGGVSNINQLMGQATMANMQPAATSAWMRQQPQNFSLPQLLAGLTGGRI